MQFRAYLLISIIGISLLSACGSFKKGYDLYKKGYYDEAIPYFKKATTGKKSNLANFYIGQSYRKSNRLREAEPYYAKVYNKRLPKTHQEDHEDDAKFYYAMVLKSLGKYKEAREQFSNYLQLGRNVNYVQRAKQELENLDKVGEILNRKTYYNIQNCDGINTAAAEFAPVPYGDKILFSSSRKEGVYKNSGLNYMGLYAYSFDDPNDCAGNAQLFHEDIYLEEVHEATAAFSRDGRTMIFARSNEKNSQKKGKSKGVKLYITERVNGEWTTPRLLDGVSSNDEEAYYGKPSRNSEPKAFVWDSSPTFSPDGQTLYFSSDREYDDYKSRSQGRIDLFSAVKRRDGTWGNVRNLGPSINTAGDDMFPFVSNDGRLYFSSDGHPGLGGLDLYRAIRRSGKVDVKNLGTPVNSKFDDLSLVFTSDSTGYFSSNRESGKGDDDIYTFIDVTPKTKTATYFLTFKTIGIELDGSEQPLPKTRVRILDANEQVVKEFFSNEQGLTDTVKIDDNATFIVLGDHLGDQSQYLTARDNFTMAGKKVPYEELPEPENDIVILEELKLEKFEIEKTKFEVFILFDYDQWDIRPDASLVLDDIVTFLKDNPEVKVELGAHTDSRGTNFDNEILAQNRAQSSVDYIVSKGIEQSRIRPQGYGEEVPKIIDDELALKYDLEEGAKLTERFINGFRDENKREELHQLNRRTEIRIIGVVR